MGDWYPLALPTSLGDSLPTSAGVRWSTLLGLGLGFTDVLTTANHLLVPPVSDGNAVLMALAAYSPAVTFGLFLAWFTFVGSIALVRDDVLGFVADTYLLVAFSVTGLANVAYEVFGTTIFKTFVGNNPELTNLYIFVVAPLFSCLFGLHWASTLDVVEETSDPSR